jgi:hypothetical protein
VSDLPPLADIVDVELVLGRALTNDESTRATLLLPIASDLVREGCCQTFTLTDEEGAHTVIPPTTVRMVVAQMVASATESGNVASDGVIRAETIGDYRVEYEPGGGTAAGMTLTKFLPTLQRWNLCSVRTLTTPIAQDGYVMDEASA